MPLLTAAVAAVVLVGCGGSARGRVGGHGRTVAGARAVGPTGPAAIPAPASPVPGEWTTDAQLLGIACPAATTCVAVGQSASDQGAVLRSVDGGATWTTTAAPQAAGQLTSVACPTTSACVAVGASTTFHPAVYASDDGGLQWSAATVPPVLAPLTAVACASSAVCVAVGGAVGPQGSVPAVLHSSDGGRTWTSGVLPPGIDELTAAACPSATDCVAVGRSGPVASTTDPAVLQSSDGGATWARRTVPVGGIVPSAVACSTTGHCSMAGYDENRRIDVFWASADGGTTWTLGSAAAGPPPAGGPPVAMACATATTCLVVTQPAMGVATGAVSLTADGGHTWTVTGHLPPAVLPSALACPTSDGCVAVGDGGGLAWATHDAGGSWAPSVTPTALGALAAVRCWTAKACVAVGQSSLRTPLVLWTADGGRRWAAAPSPDVGGGLDAVACPGRRVCVAVGGGQSGIGTALVLRTTDGGRSWQTERLDEAGTLQAVACPTALLCVAGGTTFSLNGGTVPQVTVASSDGGRTWHRMGESPDTAAVAGLSCPTPRLCLAVAGGLSASPVVLSFTDPGRPGARWVVRTRIPRSWHLTSIACPTASTCLAAGSQQPAGAGGLGDLVVDSHDAGRHWQVATAYPPYGRADAIGCISVARCAVVGDGRHSHGAGALVSVAGRFRPAVLPGGVGNLYGVTCLTSHRCLAVGTVPGTAAILASDDAGVDWHAQHLPGVISLAVPPQATS